MKREKKKLGHEIPFPSRRCEIPETFLEDLFVLELIMDQYLIDKEI